VKYRFKRRTGKMTNKKLISYKLDRKTIKLVEKLYSEYTTDKSKPANFQARLYYVLEKAASRFSD